jgi:hypothetical protein
MLGVFTAPRFAAAIPGAELIPLPAVGHVPMLDDPELVTQTILDFTAHTQTPRRRTAIRAWRPSLRDHHGIAEPHTTTDLATLYDQEVMPWSRATLGVVVLDDSPFLTTGPAARKTRNLVANPACILSMRLDRIDLV